MGSKRCTDGTQHLHFFDKFKIKVKTKKRQRKPKKHLNLNYFLKNRNN